MEISPAIEKAMGDPAADSRLNPAKEEMESSSSIKSTSSPVKKFKIPEKWADAAEFVPSWLANSGSAAKRSYADVVGHEHATASNSNSDHNQVVEGAQGWEEWCPYHLVGECRFGDQCLMLHGTKCEYCGENCLHPYDTKQREAHTKECVAQHEKDMEISFAIARSIDKSCGICYEKVMMKEPSSEQRFGILPSCNHCFCLSCIRRWRQAKNFENKIIRACPECRVTSDFVCPSRYWVESKEDKDKLIGCYKVALSQINCRYYRNGEGSCPFGNKCFYRHALNGTLVDLGPPKRVLGSDGLVPNGGNQAFTLWDFVEEWEFHWVDIEDMMDNLGLHLADLDLDDDESFDESYWLTR